MKVLRRNYRLSELYIFRKTAIRILFNYRKIINFILVQISLSFRMKSNLGSPLHILIEPTSRCNYKCVKCEQFNDMYADEGLFLGGKDMPFENYRKIIDDIGDRLITLRLWHYGEPLLNNDLFLMVEYAKRKDIFVVVSSNLSLLEEKAAQKMIKSGLDYLIVSCDGASEHTYNLYHGQDYFKKVINNLKKLIVNKKNLRSPLPFIEFQFIVMKENEEEIPKINELAANLGVNKLTYLKLQADRLDIKRLKNFSSIENILPTNKNFRFASGERKLIKFCRVPWEETVIRYSGLVIPCALDIGQQHKMGRLFQDGKYIKFKDVWNSQHYRDFRKQVRNGLNVIVNCSSCEKRDNNNNDQINTPNRNSVLSY